jgi:DNA-binding MarR family transcriptional regulator
MYIVGRYTSEMKPRFLDPQYRALAELRYQIRLFVHGSDAAAQAMGLEPQQFQALLAIRGLPSSQAATIRVLAERLLLKHHSAVGLIDRLEANGFVIRCRNQRDRRQVLVTLSPTGQRLLEKIARQRLEDLRSNGRALVEALGALLEGTSKVRMGAKRPASEAASRKTTLRHA